MPHPNARPEPQSPATGPVPELTHQASLESVRSPITPGNDVSIHQDDHKLKIGTGTSDTSHEQTTKKGQATDGYPFPAPMSAPATTTEFPNSPKVPSKDLPFLSQDPYANVDDDIIPFDKNKPIVPSRSGSVRSIMSTNSIQSLKRGFGSLKRKLTRRNRPKPSRRATDQPKLSAQSPDEHGITPVNRTQTFMVGPSFHAPRRVETYQVSAMAF